MSTNEKGSKRPWRLPLFAVLLLLLSAAVAYLSLITPISLRGPRPPLKVGEVSLQDLRAPSRIEFASETLTEASRQQAERQVSAVYTPPDEVMARGQLDRLREALDQVESIRSDPSMLLEDQRAAIAQVEGLHLQTDSVAAVLLFSDSRWQLIQQEALRTLEQAMRQQVREDNLEAARSNLPSVISLTLSDAQAQTVAEIVSPFVVPNSYYSPEMTDQARQAARDAVEPVSRSFLPGEIVVQRGTVIDDSDLEALTRLGLVEEKATWEDYLSALALIAVLGGFVALYFMRRRPAVGRDPRNLLLIAIIFIVFLVGARLAIPDRAVVPYLYPLSAFGLIIAALFGVETSLVLSVPLALLATYGLFASDDLVFFYLLPSLCGTLALVPARRVSNFVRAGVVIALTGIGVILAYRVPFTPWDWTGLATLAGAALFNAGASASVALLVQFFLAQAIGLTTPMHLLEVSRSDHPLLQAVLRGAPGTYQHSLNVANLAEPAADAIGADSLLVRVGALYHDCGKSVNPQFFIENQPPDNLDPHDGMDPVEAARLVIKHIPDGLALARKYRLPQRVRDFISEHHGTLITRYQYTRALELAGGDATQVDIERFRYPGPAPSSRETAILMLSDMTEARVRAERPEDEEALRAAIQRTIEICQKNGQLDDTRLTLRDLYQITESFTSSLQGNYHPRIAYPAGESAPAPEETPSDSHRD
jgi:hypothetical protein